MEIQAPQNIKKVFLFFSCFMISSCLFAQAPQFEFYDVCPFTPDEETLIELSLEHDSLFQSSLTQLTSKDAAQSKEVDSSSPNTDRIENEDS